MSIVSSGLLLVALLGQSAGGDDKSDDAYRAAQFKRMRVIAENFAVEVNVDQQPATAKQMPNPLLRYNDSTRRLDESTLWLWTERELPTALLAVEFYPNDPRGPRWLFEIVSLSESKIGVTRGEGWNWQARQPGVVRQTLPGDLKPADKPAFRLTQARQICRRFGAYEKEGTDGRIELRPLSNPLYRYSDPDSGMIDGFVFAFANGTNPEVFVLLEARPETKTAPAAWSYGLAQMTGAEVHASLDDREVWSQPEADPPAVRDSYVNDWLRDEAKEASVK